MVDDLAGKSLAQRVQTLRERRGMTRETLAGLVGRSAEWLKKLERGTLREPRFSMVLALAEALNLHDASELTGTGGAPLVSFHRIPHDAVTAVREAVLKQLLTPPDGSVDLEALELRVAQAWDRWHSSPTQRTDVGRILPTLITDARIAARLAEGSDRRRANRLLAYLYPLVQHLLAWTSEPELYWVVSDRGVSAAQEADEPEPLALGAWQLGNARRAVGDSEGALEIVLDAVTLLTPRLDGASDDLRGLWGSLHLHAAITSARDGREGDAWAYWSQADETAGKLPDGYHHPMTQFGRSNVAVHAVSVGADLSKRGEARRRAELVDPDTIPSLERRSRLLIDTARSYQQRRDWSGMLHFLRSAHQVSSEAVIYSPLARQMAVNAVDGGGPLVEREARAFASQLGVTV
jgi:transcriptional regulator with XRE-family HTH domain